MVAWGINDFGQLGNGSTVYATSPGQVVGLEDIAVSDIAAAGWHSLAITTSGGKRTEVQTVNHHNPLSSASYSEGTVCWGR